MSEQVAASKMADEIAKGGVLGRLIAFAVALAVVPISTFFGTKMYLFSDNSTYAAIAAVFAANGVLVIYILQSIAEDRAQNTKPIPRKGDKELKKDQ